MRIKCSSCHKTFGVGPLFTCPDCGGIFTVEYDYLRTNKKSFIDNKKSGIWRFWQLLPFERFSERLITLKEGNTPLIKSKNLGKRFKVQNLYFKDEGKNPNGSFKDRAIAVGFNRALQDGAKKLMVYSSGNAAISLASFAQETRIKAQVFIESENKKAIKRCRNLGAEVIEIPTKRNYFKDFRLFFWRLFSSWEVVWQKEYLPFFKNEFRSGWYPLQPNIIINPYQIEGVKTISYEICETLNWEVPDVVISPGITGDLLLGQWRGYQDLYKLGLIDNFPRLILVAREKKNPFSLFNSLVIRAVKDSKGEIIYTSEEESINAQKIILETEKIKTEAISASIIAALPKLKKPIEKKEVVVCLLSGSNF